MNEVPDLTSSNDPINPPVDESYELLHERTYSVKSYRVSDDVMMIRGAVADDKPAGLYIFEDTERMRLHHMVVDLFVKRPSMDIIDAKVHFAAYPNTSCPAIVDHYSKLIGMNLGRGFSAKIRETFGGPKGCSHTTALLLAMAPVSVQSNWSNRFFNLREIERGNRTRQESDSRKAHQPANINSCHLWHEDGDVVANLKAGVPPLPPLPVRVRLRAVGISNDEWVSRMAD